MNNPPALIPAAGLGTRLRPISRYVSKQMLPLGNYPVIKFVIDEALSAGCSPVVLITNPEDRVLSTFVEEQYNNEPVTITHQAEPMGLAHALCQGYETIGVVEQTAMLLPDNIVLQGNGIQALFEIDHPESSLVFGTIEVSKDEAQYFGNSGKYETRKSGQKPHGVETITALQEKGSGNFSQTSGEWPQRRTVGRALLPQKFFGIASTMNPDPESGEIDDVPVYRAMLESDPAVGMEIDGTVYDMGNPERYTRLCARYFEIEYDQ